SFSFLCSLSAHARVLLSFPTRRSSDLNSSPSRGGSPPFRRSSRSNDLKFARALRSVKNRAVSRADTFSATAVATNWLILVRSSRSEEHTSELQSLTNLVCRLLLEKKNN